MPVSRPIKENTRYLPEPVRVARMPEPMYEERIGIQAPPPQVITPPPPRQEAITTPPQQVVIKPPLTPPPQVIKTPPPPPPPTPPEWHSGFAKGGKVMSASRRGDGIAQRGKTKGKMY